MNARRFKDSSLTVLLSILLGIGISTSSAQAEEVSYTATFIISAYYSPCLGQGHYVTGSYEGDIRLNGRGTNGADGTPVYPGMIAAPSKYPFGTKMSIPGIGITAVHDRGGAIVAAGEQGHAYDRLDVWMGQCDEGLQRALNWGKRTVENVTVYGIDPSLQESIYVEGFSSAENLIKNVVLAPQIFPNDLWHLSSGDDVKRLQEYLTQLGYYQGSVDGFYGDETQNAVIAFQKDQNIIQSTEDWGAGHFGVKTRKALDLAVARMKEELEKKEKEKEENAAPEILKKYPDLAQYKVPFTRTLKQGMSGSDVQALQEELARLGYLRIDAKDYGYFGEITQHALFKLQQKWGLVQTKTDAGAGTLGPETQSRMNALMGARVKTMGLIALHRENQMLNTSTALAKEPTFTRELTQGDRGEDVQKLQTVLKELGFFKGLFVTQFYGEQTKNAVYEFQKANQLVSSNSDEKAGRLEGSTLELLNGLI